MIDSEKRKAFNSATNLHAAEGELFGMTREQVAKSLLGQAVWMHIDALGHDATIAALARYAKHVESEKDDERD